MGIFESIRHKAQNTALNIGAAIARPYVNKYLDGVGVLKALEIDAAAKVIGARIELAGETELVKVEIVYRKESGDDHRKYIRIIVLKTSRVWLNAVFEKFVRNKRDRLGIPEMLFPFL